MDKFKEGLKKKYPSFPDGLIQLIMDRTFKLIITDVVERKSVDIKRLFLWSDTKEGYRFWLDIKNGDLTPYYEMYENDRNTANDKIEESINVKRIQNAPTVYFNPPAHELRYDPKFTPPFRVGKKKTILDSKGHEVIILNSELQAKLYCDYLNN